jgi:UDP-N-acetylmuramyl pentapeptide phosphotransferase/UDP-N-acetylglucosamine-1-phosphate transferase
MTSALLSLLMATNFFRGLLSRFSDLPSNLARKVHLIGAPRTGGFSLLIGILVGVVVEWKFLCVSLRHEYKWILFFGAGVFLVGVYEDRYAKLSPAARFWATFVLVFLAQYFSGIAISSIDIGFIDVILGRSSFVTYLFTAIAILGLINAYNISDGLHGLSSGLGVVALVMISMASGDSELSSLALIAGVSLAGFSVVNWITGRVFLGDGGAYLVGFLIASFSIFLAEQAQGISPWFLVLISIYPITETLFSMVRRLLGRKSVGTADAFHLHTILFRVLCAKFNLRGFSAGCINSLSAASIVFFSSLYASVGFFVRGQTTTLICLCVFYAIAHGACYFFLKRLDFTD